MFSSTKKNEFFSIYPQSSSFPNKNPDIPYKSLSKAKKPSQKSEKSHENIAFSPKFFELSTRIYKVKILSIFMLNIPYLGLENPFKSLEFFAEIEP